MLGAMTEPQFGGSEHGPPPPPPPQPPGYPPSYPPPAGQYPPAYVDPAAPYGRHPLTGEPLSDKSKLVAGLLQLIGLFGLVGIGAIIWGIIDAVLLFTDKVRDPEGRPLRDGT